MVSATFTPSMAATHSSSTPFAPCASAAWRICSGTLCRRAGPARQSAGPGADPRKNICRVQHLLRRRTRPLRRSRAARPHRPRSHLQSGQRCLSLSIVAARLFALHHLDARPGLGHARFRRAAGVPSVTSMDLPTSRRRWPCWSEPRVPAATSTSSRRPRSTASAIGIPARRSYIGSATGKRNPPIRTTTTNRSMHRPAPSPPRDCFVSVICLAQRAKSTPRPDSPSSTSYCRSRISRLIPITKEFCCTASTIAPTDGTTFPRSEDSLRRSPACGVTIICWSFVS